MLQFRTAYRFFLLLLTLSLAVQSVVGAEPEANGSSKTVRLLTIGNSFSQNATRFLSELAKAGGHELIHRPIVVGGASLELHTTKFQKNEQNAEDPAGRYANGLGLKEMLRAERWDVVTIQQASIKSHDVETYRPFAAQLANYVKEHAPQARLLVHETWAYRRDDPRFTDPSSKANEPATQEAMYRGLAAAYRSIAKELGAKLIPVGDAFQLADNDPKYGYRVDTTFDFRSAQAPALPNQAHSLHVGWRWQSPAKGEPRLAMDGHHANQAGEYLGGCVWYEVLFNESSVGNSAVPTSIDPGYAAFLQETAHRAVNGLTK